MSSLDLKIRWVVTSKLLQAEKAYSVGYEIGCSSMQFGCDCCSTGEGKTSLISAMLGQLPAIEDGNRLLELWEDPSVSWAMALLCVEPTAFLCVKPTMLSYVLDLSRKQYEMCTSHNRSMHRPDASDAAQVTCGVPTANGCTQRALSSLPASLDEG